MDSQDIEAMRDAIGQPKTVRGDDDAETVLWNQMYQLHKALSDARPQGRSELSRRYAVTITEFEKVMAYYNLMVIEEFNSDER